MKRCRVALIAALWLLAPAAVRAQTQAGMNAEACAEYKRADDELNQTYRRVLSERGADRSFVSKMRGAQRAWVAYRDAHLASLYPAADVRRTYGSVYETCRCTALTEATRLRTNQLRRWLEGAAEGDVCAGSTMKQHSGGVTTEGVPEYERLGSPFRKRWTLVESNDRAPAGEAPYLEFDVKQGRFSGSSGCNRIFGGYRVGFGERRDDLSLTAINSTKRACSNDEARQTESDFLKALGAATRFRIEGDTVRLYRGDDPVLTFRVEAN